jgi:hypothetical protein
MPQRTLAASWRRRSARMSCRGATPAEPIRAREVRARGSVLSGQSTGAATATSSRSHRPASCQRPLPSPSLLSQGLADHGMGFTDAYSRAGPAIAHAARGAHQVLRDPQLVQRPLDLPLELWTYLRLVVELLREIALRSHHLSP